MHPGHDMATSLMRSSAHLQDRQLAAGERIWSLGDPAEEVSHILPAPVTLAQCLHMMGAGRTAMLQCRAAPLVDRLLLVIARPCVSVCMVPADGCRSDVKTPGAASLQFFIMESGVIRVDLRLLDSASPGSVTHWQRLPPDLLREAPARWRRVPTAEHNTVTWLKSTAVLRHCQRADSSCDHGQRFESLAETLCFNWFTHARESQGRAPI